MAPLFERAFQLAKSGRFATVTQLQQALRREGYQGVAAHFAGRQIRQDLKQTMKAALTERRGAPKGGEDASIGDPR